MNILLRLPKSSIVLHRKVAIESVTSASYSIYSSQRNQTFQKPSVKTYYFIPKRHKSFSEAFNEVYTNVSHSTAVSYFQNALIDFHDLTGLPWWATIITFTVGLRLAMFPFAVYRNKVRARLHLILENEMPAMNEELKREVAAAKKQWNLNDQQTFRLYRRSFKKQYKLLIERDNCHPFKTTIMLWIQIPVWVCHSIGIRNIMNMQPNPNSATAQITFAQLSADGFLWLPSLIEADSSYIIPAIWCITNLINIELGVLERGGLTSKFSTYVTAIFRLIMIGVTPIAATVPSCLSLYWCTSSVCTLTQNLVLLSPKVKQTFGIPTNTKCHMEHPYRTLLERFSELMEKRRNWLLSSIKLK